MSVAQACCTEPPKDSAHTPQGTHETFGGVKVYSVGPKNSALAVVFVYDIFGYHPNTVQTIDELSKLLNARVVAPDYFEGKPYPMEKFPITDFQAFMAYLNEHASWEKCHDYSLKVYEALKSEGHKSIGTAGLCWGAKICMSVANTEKFSAGHVLLHPSFLKPEDANAVKTPLLVIPSKDEADFIPFMENLQKANPEVSKKSEHHRFDDMEHGFAGARGSWADPVVGKRIAEAVALAKKFYERNM